MMFGLYRYVWKEDGWRLPTGATCGIDLRPVPVQGIREAVNGWCFSFSTDDGRPIAQSLDEAVSGIARQHWESAVGHRLHGDTCLQLLWDQLTRCADPSGDDGPKPLVPTHDGRLNLLLNRYGSCGERFVWGHHPHTNQVQAVIQRDFERLWEATGGADICRRVLDVHCLNHGIRDWRQFVPRRLRKHVPGPLPHATTITDNFNRTDATSLGTSSGGWSWSDLGGDWQIVSNAARSYAANSWARADSDLSSSDMYGQFVWSQADGGRLPGAGTRCASAATTFYYYLASNASTAGRLRKVVTGTESDLAVGSTEAPSFPHTIKQTVSGSDLEGLRDGVSKVTVTDTAITGNVRGVMRGAGTGSGDSLTVDDFEAGDLVAAAVKSRSLMLTGVGV